MDVLSACALRRIEASFCRFELWLGSVVFNRVSRVTVRVRLMLSHGSMLKIELFQRISDPSRRHRSTVLKILFQA